MKKLLQYLMILGLVGALGAQETSATKEAHEAPKRPAQRFYKLNFVIYELEDGKRINERTYSLPVATLDGNPRDSSINVGNRVPIVTGQDGQFQYIDIGLLLECNVAEQNDRFIVNSNLTLSSIVVPEAGKEVSGAGGGPLVRQIKQHFNTLVSPGKPTLVTSIDDINSKKRLQVEVTATKLE